MELEGAHKATESNPLLKAGIQIKADLTEGCPNASSIGVLTTSQVIDSVGILL